MTAAGSAWTLRLDELDTRLPKIFDEFGFALVESIFNECEIEAMRREMDAIVERFDVDAAPKSVFSTLDEDKVGRCSYSQVGIS